MSRSGSRRWPRRTTSRSRWRWRSWCGHCAAVRCVWICGRSPRNSRCPSCRGPHRTAGSRPCRRAHSSPRSRCCGCHGDLLYLDRYWLEEQQVCDDVLTLLSSPLPGEVPSLERLFPAGWEEQRAAAEIALHTVAYGVDRRPGHGQDDDGRAASGAAGRAGVAVRRAAAADSVGRADREGGGQTARGRAVGGRQARRRRPRSPARTEGVDDAPAVAVEAGQLVAVPAPPGEPAAARRDRGGRDVDGVADDDGPAVGGGAPGCAADPRR